MRACVSLLLDLLDYFNCRASNLYSVSNQETIAQLLASLPEEERIILTLHYLRGKSSGDIAILLQVPERAVIAVISSGKSRLKGHLGI
jgi:DNA-directed RNA polymerase specialized sigma24 family protein